MTVEEELALALLEAHPPHAAMALERLSPDRAATVLLAVQPNVAGAVLAAMTPTRAAQCLAVPSPADAGAMLAGTPADDAARITRAIEPARRETILAAMPDAAGESLRRVLRYPEGTAGAEMDPAIFQVPEDVLAADARDRLRRAARKLLYYVYVVNREGRLVGVLDIPELMLASGREPVGAAMQREPDRLSAWMPVAIVREHPAWHRYHAMPVVDESDRLVGAIRYQTLRRLDRDAAGRGTDHALLTARALGELFRVGTAGLVAGVAAAGAASGGQGRDDDR